MSHEERQAQVLADWLDGAGGELPDGLDVEVAEAMIALRPDLAPPPRVTADDILAGLAMGPLVEGASGQAASVVGAELVAFPPASGSPAPPRRRRRWWAVAGAGTVGLLMAALALMSILPLALDESPAMLPPAGTDAQISQSSPTASSPEPVEMERMAAPPPVSTPEASPRPRPPAPQPAVASAPAPAVASSLTHAPPAAEPAPEEPLELFTVADLDDEWKEDGADLADYESDEFVGVASAGAAERAFEVALKPSEDGWEVAEEEPPQEVTSSGGLRRGGPPRKPDAKKESAALNDPRLRLAEALFASGDAQQAGATLEPLIVAPQATGQRVAFLTANYYIAARNPEAALRALQRGIALGSADIPERRSLLDLQREVQKSQRPGQADEASRPAESEH